MKRRAKRDPSSITYLDPRRVTAKRQTAMPRNPYRGEGYGPKVPSSWMLEIDGKTWYRVYVMIWSNSGSPYVLIKGKRHLLGSIEPRDLRVPEGYPRRPDRADHARNLRGDGWKHDRDPGQKRAKKSRPNMAWELWTRGARNDRAMFVRAFADKGLAQQFAKRLERSHPGARYMLKRRRVPATRLTYENRAPARKYAERTSARRDPTRDYEFVVYPECLHSDKGVKVHGTSFGSASSLAKAKSVAKAMGNGAGIYSVTRGAFEGWINFNGRYVSFRRGHR